MKGITEEEVKKVYDQLRKDGINPSAAAVRGVLGTGSKTTIVQHLKAIRQNEQGLYGNRDRPVYLTDKLQRKVSQVPYSLKCAAEEEYESETINLLESENQRLQEDNAAMTDLIMRVEAKLEASEKQSDRMFELLERIAQVRPELKDEIAEIQALRPIKAGDCKINCVKGQKLRSNEL
ncbi:DNA-binding protein, partial [Phormidesmis sp. 146-20]